MKKLLSVVMMVVTLMVTGMFTGCKSIPTADKMYNASYAIGVSTGMVLNMTSIPDDKRNIIIDIISEVKYYIPETNQTFKEAWTPIARSYVNKLVNNGKLDPQSADLIMHLFGIACDGLDYIFDVRYPKAKSYKELVESAVHGFTTGLLTVYKPVDNVSSRELSYDSDAFNYLMNNR